MIIPMPISFSDAKMNTFFQKVMHLELLEKLMSTYIILSSHTHSTKYLQWLVSQGPFTLLKNRIMYLIRSHALTASRPTLTIVVIQSGFSYCQVFNSAYFLALLTKVSKSFSDWWGELCLPVCPSRLSYLKNHV